jgi:hypothetical protein
MGDFRKRAGEGDQEAQNCLSELLVLGERLGFAPGALQ